MTTSRSFTNPTDCPVVHTMSLIGGRWKPVILHSLKDGKQRFGTLTTQIPSISHKILTEQLRALEATGLVKTKQFEQALPKTEYSLTKKGKSLLPIINAMSDWGSAELTQVQA
ncbi:MAG: winged helix-turn-helix transcriptional regulator [Aureispira sp.]